jgi:hypothetical protein
MVWFHLYLFLFAFFTFARYVCLGLPLKIASNKKAQPHGWACLTKELTTKSFNMNHKKTLKN